MDTDGERELNAGLTIFVFAAASPRNQVTENLPSRDVYRNSNNQNSDHDQSQQIDQKNEPNVSSQQGDSKTKSEEYQGVLGKPGVDFPILTYIPRTGFTCRGKKSGYYADLDTSCQVFHICEDGRKVSFLCPNGTIFQQSDLICDWWFKVDCATSPTLYDESAEQFYEETIRRKENRRVQEQERRVSKRKQSSREASYVKKDINVHTQNQYDNNYRSREEYLKETQIPSETASFVDSRYSTEQQKRYFKNINEVNQFSTKSTSDFSNFKTTTEKIVSRGSRTYSNNFSSQYRNHLPEIVKTTTQHTIYSPTVPPFTTRYTTKTPPSTTQFQIKSSTRKSVPGFFITTVVPFAKFVSTSPAPKTDYYSTTTKPRVVSDFEFSTVPFSNGRNTVLPSIPTPFKTNDANKQYLPKANSYIPTPRPTLPTEYTTLNAIPTVTENLNNMIRTLEEIDNNPNINIENRFGGRPGLDIPPSAGPKTLHSLAVYFATALDNLVSNNESETTDKEEVTTLSSVDNSQVTLLSKTTQNKYNNLFDIQENGTEPSNIKTNEDIDFKSLVEHDAQYNDLDLDGQQSRGPISSTPRIRQLAQVFTQALSAYLDNPDTFKRVLEEIRPTEPPLHSETETSTIPTTTEYKSYTKEEDEVLDFSDADKSSTYRPYSDNIRTTVSTIFSRSSTEAYLNEIPTNLPLESSDKNDTIIKRIPTPNSFALDLNHELKLSNASLQEIDEASAEDTTESDDYFPFHTGDDEEDARIRATAKPYGAGVKPENSTPISLAQSLASRWGDLTFNNSYQEPADDLLPPFKISLLNKKEYNNTVDLNDEYLQSAHSQSFVSHNRKGKQFNFDGTTTEYSDSTTYNYHTTNSPSTTYFNYETTTDTTVTDISTTPDAYTTQTSTFLPSTTTFIPSTTTETTEQTTLSKAVPNNHWSTSPEVTKLWENTLYVDPLIINRNLGDNTEPTTYRPDFSTLPYRTTTDYDDIDLRFSSTEEPSTTYIPTTDANIYTTYYDLGIHSLLNNTELEIASSQAKQIFGNLNRTEQDLLIEKMKEAESNSTVRRLILLLVSTCDASLSNNKTVQQTRNTILQALLNLPSNNISEKAETNNRIPKQLNVETTTVFAETTSLGTKFKAPQTNDIKDVNEDTRALELLRSLYSLAAKWGKK